MSRNPAAASSGPTVSSTQAPIRSDSAPARAESSSINAVSGSNALPAAVVVAFWHYRQATPGKIFIGARIVDATTGGPTTMRQNVVRYLAYFLSIFFLFLGFLWVAFDRRKQGWHDKLAGTVVVRRKGGATQPVKFDASNRA